MNGDEVIGELRGDQRWQVDERIIKVVNTYLIHNPKIPFTLRVS